MELYLISGLQPGSSLKIDVAPRPKISQHHHEAGQDEDLVDEPVGLPDVPIGLLEEKEKFRHDDDDFNDGNTDREPVGVGLPAKEGVGEPEMGDPPEIPVDVGAKRVAIGGIKDDREDEFDHQGPGGQKNQPVGKKAGHGGGTSAETLRGVTHEGRDRDIDRAGTQASLMLTRKASIGYSATEFGVVFQG